MNGEYIIYVYIILQLYSSYHFTYFYPQIYFSLLFVFIISNVSLPYFVTEIP